MGTEILKGVLNVNLEKLFQMQKVLRDRINYNESDRFNKLVLALLVELGECANEWRGFKFWSKDQEPRTYKEKEVLVNGVITGIDSNPLLEEYVDGLHFVLELGIELGFTNSKPHLVEVDDTLEMFTRVFHLALTLSGPSNRSHKEFYYERLLSVYLGLGKSIGLTWEQIEQAYMDKNKVNHERQESGY